MVGLNRTTKKRASSQGGCCTCVTCTTGCTDEREQETETTEFLMRFFSINWIVQGFQDDQKLQGGFLREAKHPAPFEIQQDVAPYPAQALDVFENLSLRCC